MKLVSIWLNLAKKTWSWIFWKSSSWPEVPVIDYSVSADYSEPLWGFGGLPSPPFFSRYGICHLLKKLFLFYRLPSCAKIWRKKRQAKAKSCLSSFSALSGPFWCMLWFLPRAQGISFLALLHPKYFSVNEVFSPSCFLCHLGPDGSPVLKRYCWFWQKFPWMWVSISLVFILVILVGKSAFSTQ